MYFKGKISKHLHNYTHLTSQSPHSYKLVYVPARVITYVSPVEVLAYGIKIKSSDQCSF